MGVEPLILGCSQKLEVGARYMGRIHTSGGEYHDMPYLVLREATHEEWLEQALKADVPPTEVYTLQAKMGFFYEVSVD